jgi:hypothetical protein
LTGPGRSRGLTRLLARTLWATRLVDRLYGTFDRIRSRLVLRFGSDAFFDAFNDAAYGGQAAYQPGTTAFRTDLFPWESRAIEAHFPKPPASILIGGAGGGREALALERRGYSVVAFEPAAPLAGALAGAVRTSPRAIEVLVGRYEDLPRLRRPDDAASEVDLRQRARFDAALLGWASFSHIRSDAGRVNALRQMSALTGGPILLSYFSYLDDRPASSTRRESFGMQVGSFRQLTETEARDLFDEAGLDVLYHQHDGWPCAVVRRRQTA